MRQLFSRVLELALGAATALVVIQSAERVETASAKGLSSIAVEDAYGAEVVAPPPMLPPEVDPKLVFLKDQVRKGRHWRIDTARGPAHVWVPENYVARTAHTVIYVHGYWQDADTVWWAHRLPEQFALSGINAMFVVPEAPQGKWDPVLWPTARALLDDLAPSLTAPMPEGRVAVVGHSGAYRTVIPWLADDTLDTVVLLDAAYVDVKPYRDWVIKSKDRRLLNVSIDTIRWSNYLHRWLPGTRTVAPFPRQITDELRTARILYVKSEIAHWALATEGVAIPAMLRALDAPVALAGDAPPLGLPPLPEAVPDPDAWSPRSNLDLSSLELVLEARGS